MFVWVGLSGIQGVSETFRNVNIDPVPSKLTTFCKQRTMPKKRKSDTNFD